MKKILITIVIIIFGLLLVSNYNLNKDLELTNEILDIWKSNYSELQLSHLELWREKTYYQRQVDLCNSSVLNYEEYYNKPKKDKERLY